MRLNRVSVDAENKPLEKDRPFRARVLCVDDDMRVGEAVGRRLRNHNIEVIRAFDGKHAIWIANTQKPDIIITDLRMPQYSGEELIECVRGNRLIEHTPIIVVTGKHENGLEERMKEIGASRTLAKPVDAEVLLDALMDELNDLLKDR